MSSTARKTFELNNDVRSIDPTDGIFQYSREEEKELDTQAPWSTDPHYFHTVKISAVALIKMVTHARSGGIYEIMGVMYGRVRDGVFWIMDAAALPVQGTETRVNAGNEAMEYMVNFQTANEVAGKTDLLRGWYHSHPGYGCWLSGIDVNTQQNNQRFNDPYLAVVIDPNRTVSAGKVEIGAFRTYPEGYTPPASRSASDQSIPMDKIEDFGVHANAYYPLKVEIFKTQLDEQLLDLLWNKYWVATLSSSLLTANRDYATSQVSDLNAKLQAASQSLGNSTANLKLKSAPAGKGKTGGKAYAGVEEEVTPLNKATKDSSRIATEAQNGIIAQLLKDKLFNTPLSDSLDQASAYATVQGRMGIRGFDVYLRERKLLQTCPMSALANTRLGIDATHYLNHLLSDSESREPLVAATGGLPLGIIARIETDLRSLERQNIKPVFVFAGLPLASRPPQKGLDPQAERETQVKNEAWSYYENGEVERAITQLTAVRNGSWTDWRDLLRAIIRLFRHRFVEFVIAPYIEFAQLAYLLQHPKGYIHAIYSSTECLMWPVDKVITSTDWNKSFTFVEKTRLIVDLNLTSEQFLDMGILAGCSISRTFPPIASDFSIKSVIDLMRHHKSGMLVCQNWRESQFKTQTYTEAFWKARLAVKFSLVLTTQGTCVPLPTVITPHGQSFTVHDVPGDLDDIFSPRIPDELYFYVCRGLISAQVVGWITSGIVHEVQPLADTGDYHRFIKDVITEGPTSPRCTTLALLADVLHPDWSKRKVHAHYFFDPPFAPVQGTAIPFNDATTQSLVAKMGGWTVPNLNLETELRRQNSSTIDLKLCLGALATEELAAHTRRERAGRVLDKKDEIVANILWRLLELRGFINATHTHTMIGKALHAANRVSRVNDRFQEPLYLLLELLRAGVVHGHRWGGDQVEPLSGGPSFGTDEEQRSILLIMRCLSILPLMFRPQQWVGPLSRELLVFNSFVRALSKSLRHLSEAVNAHIMLSGHARRNRDDYNDVMISLPFQSETNTGFGILAKTYLDATIYHHDEIITEATASTDKAKQAKKDALDFVEQSFSSIKLPIQEVERGFRFWDSIMVAIRTLDKEQGPNPSLAQRVVGKDVIEQFEKAEKWLRPMRP
ncbi:COP9 signalosome complex subunit 5 [Kwoniella heveanensis BCC8398]|uniref:COP9 signalosome complex subunit 5 n=1 Tax=Kwoniella heveanensis BCC8398 TaxID=1296120 RepID=A0A1B9GRW1_9TREE|nr:COP9 signalosome complex subunit 5 [Kwoniella heveanensis BCC8398]